MLLLRYETRSFTNNLTYVNMKNYVHYSAINTAKCGSSICIRKCCSSGCYYEIDSNSTNSCEIDDLKKFTKQSCYIDEEDGFDVGILGCDEYEMMIEYNRQKMVSTNYVVFGNLSYYYFTGINRTLPFRDYCMDEINGTKKYYVCTKLNYDALISWPTHLTVRVLFIPFLVATCLIYAILPKKNVHRQALIFHTLFRAISDILVALDLDDRFFILDEGTSTICIISVYIHVFCRTTSYFWMNVLCIDVWLTFSKLRRFKKPLSKKNVLYKILSIYAWGIPALTVLVMGILDGFNIYIQTTLYMEGLVCSREVVPYYLFLFVPLLFVLVFDGVLFVLTIINIRRARKEIAAMLKHCESTRHTARTDIKCNLYWKLYCLMGNPVLNFRLIGIFATSDDAWARMIDLLKVCVYYENFIHGMYGIIIFITFVCKKNIWKELKEAILSLLKSLKRYIKNNFFQQSFQ